MNPADVAALTRDRNAAYLLIIGSPGWPDVQADLLAFAASADDPAIRAGRYDVIARLMRVAHQKNGAKHAG